MKLRNKKTGQLGNFIINKDHFECVDLDYVPEYRNLAELNKEWEDYEEPEGIIGICQCLPAFPSTVYIEMATEGAAEKAVEKLKAWKRLRDDKTNFQIVCQIIKSQAEVFYHSVNPKYVEDLYRVFGGEE